MGIGFRAIPHFHRAKTPTTTSYSGVQGTVVCRKRDNTSKVQKNNEEHNGKQFGLVFGQRQIWKAGTSFVFSIRDFIYKLQMKKRTAGRFSTRYTDISGGCQESLELPFLLGIVFFS